MKFIPGFANLCEHLRKLLKADAVRNWSASSQTSFDKLKQRVSQPPVLAYFDSSSQMFFTCDAPVVALGALLFQHQGGEERSLAFASRTMSPAFGQANIDIFTCMVAFHIDYRSQGIEDVAVVRRLRSSSSASATLVGADRLFQYIFSVVNRPGRFNVVADCL